MTTALHQDYVVEVWQTEDGLPQNSITSIAQTPDGYLWLATFNGLARFDGDRFAIFDDHNTPALPSSSLIRLDLDNNGGLWIITRTGGLAQMANGRFRSFTAREGLPASGASVVGQALDGRCWMLDRQGGLHRLRDGRFVPAPGLENLGTGPLRDFRFDDEGDLWLLQGRTLVQYREGRTLPLTNPDGRDVAAVDAFGPRAHGGFVLITSLGLQKYQRGKWEPGCVPCPNGMSNVTCLIEDRHGQVWVGTYGYGLFQYDSAAGWRRFTAGNGLLHNAVRSVFEDRESNLWVGTDGGGLHRLKPRLFRSYEAKDGLTGRVVMSVSEGPGGVFWFGLNGGGVNRWEAGSFMALTQPPLLRTNDNVYSILTDRTGVVWAGTYGRGLLYYREGRFESCLSEDGPLIGALRVLFEDRAGVIWAGGSSGLWRIQAGRCKRVSFREGTSDDEIHALAEDSNGGLYIGTDGGGLYRLHENRITRFTEREGLADNHVSCLYVEVNDTVWVGGSCGGLTRLHQGRLDRYSTHTGLPSNRISAILADDYGRLWFGSERGVFWVSRAELNEGATSRSKPVLCHQYSRSDGLSGIQCSRGVQPASCKARDGKLWFATVNGVLVVDPRNLPSNPLPPPVVIEKVTLDDRVHDLQSPELGIEGRKLAEPTESGTPVEASLLPGLASRSLARSPLLTIPAEIRRVEFGFSGLSLVAPEAVRFRYRMDGYDSDWIEGGTRRVAHYTRIPPGQYLFRVTACNNEGLWNETGAELGVLVLEPWWEAWWFRGVATASLAGLVLFFYERRIRWLKRIQSLQQTFSRRLLESQEAERQRIAAELHDGLGQDLLVIKNRALLGLQDSAITPPAVEQLGEISRLASQTLGEVREISHNLRPFQLDRLGLTKALQAMAAAVSRASGIPIETELEPVDGLLPQPLEIHFYRIAQELLNNIVKHSHAASARLEAKCRAQKIILAVEDDGCGFDVVPLSQLPARQGMGLTDIAERVRILGGTWRCDSRPAAGTRSTVEIPISAGRSP